MIMCIKRDLREFLLSLFFGGGGGGAAEGRHIHEINRKSSSISFGSILAPSMTIFCDIKVVPFLFFLSFSHSVEWLL